GVRPRSLDGAGLVGRRGPVGTAPADGLPRLSWSHRPPPAAGPLVILFHGNGGAIEIRAAKAKAYIDAGFGMLLVEYRGYGGNPGSPSEAGPYSEGRAASALAAAAGLASQPWDPLRRVRGEGV